MISFVHSPPLLQCPPQNTNENAHSIVTDKWNVVSEKWKVNDTLSLFGWGDFMEDGK